MKYAFVLGRVYTLSIAELIAVFKEPDLSSGIKDSVKILEASEEIIIVETETPIYFEKLQKKLGGIVKILEVVDTLSKREQDSINFSLKHYFKPSVLKKKFFKEYKGKIQFGVSIYLLDMDLAGRNFQQNQNQSPKKNDRPPVTAFGEPNRIGMMIKKTVVETGSSCRLVLPEFNSLSLASVVVSKNNLLLKGSEICIIASKNKVYTAKTLIVQDFEDYGRRDYQRPVRDEKQGMIPPKVAQIMLNLSGCKPNQSVLDPFCGIGTVIQEGLLLGYKMLGSDINSKAIKGSEQNLEWFRNRYKIAPNKYHLETSDVKEVSKLLVGQNISAIVTEGTLGPIYSKYPKQEEINTNFKDLEELYKQAFADFSTFLPKQAKIILCIPAYKKGRNSYEQLPSLDWAVDLGYNLLDIIPESEVKKMNFLKLTDRNTAIYDRKDQIVAREIVVFEKA